MIEVTFEQGEICWKSPYTLSVNCDQGDIVEWFVSGGNVPASGVTFTQPTSPTTQIIVNQEGFVFVSARCKSPI